jgi:hypothetical protein
MRQPRFFLYALVGAVLGVAACSSESTAPGALETQATPSFSLTGSLSALLLECSPEQPVWKSKEFGPSGGEFWVGRHYLVIPKNALTKKVTISGEVVSGNFNSVRFYPEGLKFGAGTKLYMSFKNCSGVGMLLPKKLVYIDEGLNLLEILSTTTVWSKQEAVAELRHFSRYAVAY